MQIQADKVALVDLAEGHVRKFISERGAFGMFAIARASTGSDQYVQSSGEFSQIREELIAMFEVLRPLAKENKIDATVICSHIPDAKVHHAIFDVETRANGRTIVMVPFQKGLFGGWKFGARQYKPDNSNVFAP